MWRHTDDQYQRDTQSTSVRLRVVGLADGEWTVTHARIDADHSNAHTVWAELGRPQDPTPEQLAEITARQGLEEVELPHTEVATDGVLTLGTELPLPSVSLFVLERR